VELVFKFFGFGSNKNMAKDAVKKKATSIEEHPKQDLLKQYRKVGFTFLDAKTLINSNEQLLFLVSQIKENAGLKDEDWNRYYYPAIARFSELAQSAGASVDYHHSHPYGLIQHSLEVALYAMRRCQGDAYYPDGQIESIQWLERCFMYCIFIGGLLHDGAKVYTNFVWETRDTNGNWNLFNPMIHNTPPESDSVEYRVKPYRNKDGYNCYNQSSHELFASNLFQDIVPNEGLKWILDMSNTHAAELFIHLIHTIASDYENGGDIGRNVEAADQESTYDARVRQMQLEGNYSFVNLKDKNLPLYKAIKHVVGDIIDEPSKYNLITNKVAMGKYSHIERFGDYVFLSAKSVLEIVKTHLSKAEVSLPNDQAMFTTMVDHGITVAAPSGDTFWWMEFYSNNNNNKSKEMSYFVVDLANHPKCTIEDLKQFGVDVNMSDKSLSMDDDDDLMEFTEHNYPDVWKKLYIDHSVDSETEANDSNEPTSQTGSVDVVQDTPDEDQVYVDTETGEILSDTSSDDTNESTGTMTSDSTPSPTQNETQVDTIPEHEKQEARSTNQRSATAPDQTQASAPKQSAASAPQQTKASAPKQSAATTPSKTKGDNTKQSAASVPQQNQNNSDNTNQSPSNNGSKQGKKSVNSNQTSAVRKKPANQSGVERSHQTDANQQPQKNPKGRRKNNSSGGNGNVLATALNMGLGIDGETPKTKKPANKTPAQSKPTIPPQQITESVHPVSTPAVVNGVETYQDIPTNSDELDYPSDENMAIYQEFYDSGVQELSDIPQNQASPVTILETGDLDESIQTTPFSGEVKISNRPIEVALSDEYQSILNRNHGLACKGAFSVFDSDTDQKNLVTLLKTWIPYLQAALDDEKYTVNNSESPIIHLREGTFFNADFIEETFNASLGKELISLLKQSAATLLNSGDSSHSITVSGKTVSGYIITIRPFKLDGKNVPLNKEVALNE
jgi:hypothetical protein